MVSIAKKILQDHLVEGKYEVGEELGIRIDHTLTQDATGTMAYLQFEAMGLDTVKTELSVSIVDHNTTQADFKNPDDHRYLQSVASKYGIQFSRPGNGICHQVFLERFAIPSKTLIGSDSHTPTAGGMGAIAIGAGGLDVAVAMGGGPFYLKTPKIVGVKITGSLPDYVAAKDVILEVLRRINVKGGVGKILEYYGSGVKTLSVPERATITNMGAETGATTSIFPSDDVTKAFLKWQKRESDWIELPAGKDEDYDEIIEIDLSKLEPLVAKPHSPGKVVPLSELYGMKVDQVAIGSCTNSSLKDMLTSTALLKGRKIHSETVLGISPGSRQVLMELAKNGSLADAITSGARILESACGPCIGMGFAPKTDAVVARTFNRNFYGRTGTKSANAYLVSPEVAVAAAIFGEFTDPNKLGSYPKIEIPSEIEIDDSMILQPSSSPEDITIIRGPNIAPLPEFHPLQDDFEFKVLIKAEDDVTTDHIMPAGSKILPLRSNLPEISMHVFEQVDETFPERALKSKEEGGGVIIGGENYGQGSSREHAALAPMFLGIKTVLTKSFARIHRDNLVNFGILPLTFKNNEDYDRIHNDDILEIKGARKALKDNNPISVKNLTQNFVIETSFDFSEREREILLAGGKLSYTVASS
ncbi:MAG: aconitate hydratase [Candidatus Hodarchaeales archaeon]|jgi:aconitate hydratase